MDSPSAGTILSSIPSSPISFSVACPLPATRRLRAVHAYEIEGQQEDDSDRNAPDGHSGRGLEDDDCVICLVQSLT